MQDDVIGPHFSTTKRASPTVVVGTTGLQHSHGQITEEWHSALQGTRGVRAFREMRDNDATIGASFHLIGSLIRQCPWRVEAAKDSGAQGEEAAQFVGECLDDMSHTFQDMVSEAFSMAWFGWCALEKVYKRRVGPNASAENNSKFTDGRLGWRKISIRAQETLSEWDIDSDGGVRGFWQVAAPKYDRVFLPIEKLIIHRTETTKGNPEGRSLLRNSWRSWFMLKRIQEIEAIGMERDLVGLPVLQLPLDYFGSTATPEKQAQRALFQKLISQIRRNEHEGIVLPAEMDKDGKPTGFKLSLLSTGGARQLDPGKAVERYEKRIAMTLFTQFLFLGMDKVGTQALSLSMVDVFVAAIAMLLDIIEETHHRFGTVELCALNGYKPEQVPRIKHGDIVSKDVEKLAKTLLDLTGAGLITPDTKLEVYLREQMRLPEMDEDEDERGDEADRLHERGRERGKPKGQPVDENANADDNNSGGEDDLDD